MKNNLFVFLFLLLLTFFSWHKIYSHTILGEGYVYFADDMRLPVFGENSNLENILRYDNFARIIYPLSERFFYDNIAPFMIFLLVALVVMVICFYLMVKILTKNKLIALFAAIFFGINYIGLSEIIGTGYYQWFSQRVPNFIFSFVSFIFYIKFLESNNRYKYYLLSIFFFTLSILSAHFSLFFLPPFIIYGSLFLFLKNNFNKKFLVGMLELIPYIAITYFLVASKPVLGPQISILTILRDKNFISDVLWQISAVTIPYNIWQPLLVIKPDISIVNLIEKISFFIFTFYVFTIFYAFKINKKWGIILLSCFLCLISASILNLYMNKSQSTSRLYDTNRYYFSLSFFTSIYWSIIIYFIFMKKNILLKLVVVLFSISWIMQNSFAIWERDKELEINHVVNKKTQEYLKNNSQRFKETSVIILPKEIGPHAAVFYQKYYGKKNTIFLSIAEINQKKAINFDRNKDYLIDFDYESRSVLDNTQKYLSIFKQRELIN